MSNVPILQSNKKKYGELLENNETVFNSVDGILSKVKGDSHSSPSGGEHINLENGSKIFSSKIRLPKEAVAAILDKKPTFVKKMSPAELSEKYPTAQYDEVLNNPDADKRAKTTATLMKAKNMAKLEAIFNAQETFKDVRGVKDGILLKDQGLNSDLESTEKVTQTPTQVKQPIQEQSNIPQEIASQVGGVTFQVEPTQRNLFENLQFNGVKQVDKIQGVNQFSYHPKQEVNQVGKVVPQVNQPYPEYNPNDLLLPKPVEIVQVEDAPIPITEPVLQEIVTPIKNKFANLQFRGYQPKAPQGVSEFNYQPVYQQSQLNQVGTTVKSIFDNLQNIPIPPEEIEVQPIRNKFEGLKYRGYEPKLPDGDLAFNYEPKNQVGVLKPKTLDPWNPTKLITQPLDATLSPESIVKTQEYYKKLGLLPPTKREDYTYPTSTVIETSEPGWLNDHPFVTTGLANVRASWNTKQNKWYPDSTNSVADFKKKYPDWTDEKIRQTIGDYQAQSIGLKADGNYEDGDIWRQRRAEVAKHYQDPDHKDWKHQNVQEIKDDKGNVVDYRFTGYVDKDNNANQIIFLGKQGTPVRALPINPLTDRPFDATPLIPSQHPLIPKDNRPALTNNPVIESVKPTTPATPLDTIELQVPKELQKAKMSTYLDLFNRQKAVPYLKNDNQTVAYQRTIPMNTLAQERGQNFMNNMYNNSDASSQLSQSIGADGYAKTLEGIDNVQLKNYQSMLNTDNQNNQLYMDAFNSNELAKNNNMAQYVASTQVVEDQFSKEGDMLKDNLRQYGLMQAQSSDDLSKRRLTGMLTNEKFLPKQFGRYTYGIDQNKNFERMNYNASYNAMLQNDQQFNNMMEKMKAAGINPKDFDDVLKAYTAQKKK